MLRYKTETRPDLVALYDIRPGNGAVNSYNPGARTGSTHSGSCSARRLFRRGSDAVVCSEIQKQSTGWRCKDPADCTSQNIINTVIVLVLDDARQRSLSVRSVPKRLTTRMEMERKSWNITRYFCLTGWVHSLLVVSRSTEDDAVPVRGERAVPSRPVYDRRTPRASCGGNTITR